MTKGASPSVFSVGFVARLTCEWVDLVAPTAHRPVLLEAVEMRGL